MLISSCSGRIILCNSGQTRNPSFPGLIFRRVFFSKSTRLTRVFRYGTVVFHKHEESSILAYLKL